MHPMDLPGVRDGAENEGQPLRAAEWLQQVRALAVLPEDGSFVPSTHSGQLATAFNFR